MGCAENKIAILLYRLVLTGAFVPNLLTAAQSVAMSFFGPQYYDPPAVRPHLAQDPACFHADPMLAEHGADR